MDIYRDLPLQPNSMDIRILKVESSENEDAPIIASLKIASLAVNPSYSALSYTWGERVFNYSIICNGLSFLSRRISTWHLGDCEDPRIKYFGSIKSAYMLIDTKGNTTGT
jgi:hypothetical protein